MVRFLAAISAALSVAACEDCPDRSVAIAIAPAAFDRGTQVALKVQFPQAVFLEPSPAAERDVRLVWSGPAPVATARWNGSQPSPDGPTLQSVQVLDSSTVEIKVLVDVANPAGTYRLSVTADSAGACDGPSGAADLTVR